MSSVVGSLVVRLSAHTAAFEKSLNKAGKRGRVFAARIGRAMKGIARAGKMAAVAIAAAAAAATVAITALVKRQMSLIDTTTKTARKLGIATKELSGLHYAAKLSGVRIETLNMALQRLARRSSEAAHGYGEAQGAIKELGFDAKQFGGRRLMAQIMLLSDAMKELKGSGNQIRLMMKMVDSEGVDLIKMMGGGAEGIRKMIKEADRIGASFDEFDAKKIEAANDAITRMGASFSGLFNKLSIELAPFIKMLSDELTEGIINASTEAGNMTPKVGKLASGIATMASAAQEFYKNLLKAHLTIVKTIRLWSRYGTMGGVVAGDKGGMNQFLSAMESELQSKVDAVEKTDWGKSIINKVIAFNKEMRDRMDTQKGGGGGPNVERYIEVNKELDKWLQKIKEIGKTEQQIYYDQLRAKGFGSIDIAAIKAMRTHHDEVKELADVTKTATDYIADLQKEWNNFGKSAAEIKLGEMIDAGVPESLIARAERWINMLKEQKKAGITPDFAGAMQRGSVEAYSTIVRDRRGSKEKEQTAIMKKTLDNEEKQTALQKMIADNTRSKPIPVGI